MLMDGHQNKMVDRIVAGRSIVALCAPPGFGKSGLAREAARRISAGSGIALRQFGQLEHRTDPRASADALLAQPTQVTVIEDMHLTDRKFLGLALERFSSDEANPRIISRIIMTLSQPSDFPLGRISTRCSIDILDADALRQRPKETAEALKSISRAKIRSRIRRLVGDWPIALELLCAWAARSQDNCESWSDLDIIRESRLGEFIDQEVLTLFSTDELSALVHASLLDVPDLDMLASVTGHRNDGRILADLAFRFKGLVDRHEKCINLQNSLRIWLRDAVEAYDERTRVELLVSMADQCSANGRLAEAAGLARMAGDTGRIRNYAHAHGALRIWIVHGFSVLKQLLENSSPQDIASSVVLRMIECIVHMKGGRINLAQDLFESLAREVGPGHPLTKDLEIVRVTLLVYGCSIERTGDLELIKNFIAEQADDAAMRTFLATLSAILNCQRARFDAAVANLIDARAQAKKVSSHYNLMFLLMHEASINLAQGKLKHARTCLSEARSRWQRDFASDVGVETVLAALSASIEFESGRLTSARNSLKKSAHRMPEAEAWFDIYFAAYETMIRINIADHGIGAMLEAVEDEARKLRAQGLPRVADLLMAIRLCVCGEACLQGQHAIISQMSWEIPPVGPTSSWQEQEVFSIARAYADYFDGKFDKAWALLENSIEAATIGGLERSRLRYLLVAFAMASAEGEIHRAHAMLRSAISIGAATSMRQIFREVAGKKLTPALQMLREDSDLTTLEEGFVDMLLNRLGDRQSVASGKLSARELEVLGLLSSGGSDKHLARQLNLSEHGVRFHLKSIFKKLGVHDRLSAVAAARKLELTT
jgi:LuxR family maltose regulon positive regulatory protein